MCVQSPLVCACDPKVASLARSAMLQYLNPTTVPECAGVDSKLNKPWPPETIQAWLQEQPTGVVAAAIANAEAAATAAPAAEGQPDVQADATAAVPAVPATAGSLAATLSAPGALPWAPAVWLPVLPQSRRAALPAGALRREAHVAALKQLEAALDVLFPAEGASGEAHPAGAAGNGEADARQLLVPPPQVGDALRQLKRAAVEGAALAGNPSPSPSASEQEGSIRWLVQ